MPPKRSVDGVPKLVAQLPIGIRAQTHARLQTFGERRRGATNLRNFAMVDEGVLGLPVRI
eukprot:719767-Pyramimonas_sp.AAC.1